MTQRWCQPFLCTYQCLTTDPGASHPLLSSALLYFSLLKLNQSQMAGFNHWRSQTPNNTTAEWYEKARRSILQSWKHLVKVSDLLCSTTGSDMTSPGCYSALRGHQSAVQGHSDINRIALTLPLMSRICPDTRFFTGGWHHQSPVWYVYQSKCQIKKIE